MSYKIGVAGNGWLVGWLVTQFSQKRLQWFFWFFAWSKGTIKVEKWQSRIFEKSSWFGGIREKVSKLAQKQTGIFLKNGFNDFFGFRPEVSTKYDLQFEWNLFFRKISNWEIFDLEIVKKMPKLRLMAIFSLVFLDFPHNDSWA